MFEEKNVSFTCIESLLQVEVTFNCVKQLIQMVQFLFSFDKIPLINKKYSISFLFIFNNYFENVVKMDDQLKLKDKIDT